MNETFDDFSEEDIGNIIPSDQDIYEKVDQWKKIIEKHSHNEDEFEEGIDLNNFTDDEEGIENEEEIIGAEALEDNNNYSDPENDRRLNIYNGAAVNFVQLSEKDQFKTVTNYFSLELLGKMIGEYKKKFSEVESKNLPLWEVETENAKTSETVNEQVIETPNGYKMISRQTKRIHQVSRANSTIGFRQGTPVANRANDNLPQINESNNKFPTFKLNTSNAPVLPPELQQILGMSNGFQLQVSYNFTGNFQGQQLSDILQGGLMQREKIPQALTQGQSINATSVNKYQKPLDIKPLDVIDVDSSSDECTVVVKTIKNSSIALDSSDEEMPMKAEVTITKKPVADTANKEASVPSMLRVTRTSSKAAKIEVNEKAKPQPKAAKIEVKEKVKPQPKPLKVKVDDKSKMETKNEKKKPEKAIEKVQKKNLQEDQKPLAKRHAPQPTKTREKSKKVRRRASISPQLSSEEEEEMQSTIRENKLKIPPLISTSKEAKTYSEVTKQSLQINPDLTLDDISCGSSCSTVTSDDDKNFNPRKYNPLRTEKKFNHRQKKLMIRTGVTSAFSESKLEVTKSETTVKQTKAKEKRHDSSSSSPYTSEDDLFDPPAVRLKNALKKTRWLAKVAARQKIAMPPPQPPKQLTSKNVDSNQNASTSNKKIQQKKMLGKENQAVVMKPSYLNLIDSDSD